MYRNLLLVIIMLLASCVNNQNKEPDDVESNNAEILCTDPVCRILIQPYDNFSQDLAEFTSKELVKYICENSWITVSDVQILSNKPLDDSLLNCSKSRYSATKILDLQLQNKQKTNDVIVGLTTKDISTSVHGKQDWGILGLAYMKKQVCVVSTYRIRNIKRDLGKVVFHEFNHAFMGMPHCRENNATCIMYDCNGVADFSRKTALCDSCKKFM